MAENIFKTILGRIVSKSGLNNVFNQAFFQWLGGGFTQYDVNNSTYLEKGYNTNPDVFAVINKQTVKTISVPYCIKEVNNKDAYSKLSQLQLATKSNYSLKQRSTIFELEKKAYKEEEKPFPLLEPNPNQTWSDIWGLHKTYLKITGNFYQYCMSPTEGTNKGVPMLVYSLPAHLMQIVLKPNAGMLTSENPIDYYMLIEGSQ